MSDFKQSIILQENCVIDFPEEDCGICSDRTVRVDCLLETIKNYLGNLDQWIDEGITCEVLAPGGIWQEGRIRLRIEFSPEGTNTLFDARQELEGFKN